MSGWYAYCALPPGTEPPVGIRGIDDSPVEALAIGGLELWASALPARPEPELARVVRHHAVVEAAAERATPVPLRFGQWQPDRAALDRHIEARAETWLARLRELAGTCEIGVRIGSATGAARDVQHEPAGETSPGRAYMRRLAERHAGAEARRSRALEIIADVQKCLGSRALQVRTDTRDPDAVSAAFLIREGDGVACRAAVDNAGVAQEGVTVAVTGPWPPYSFVE
jgi:hypothetical protein